MDEKQTYLRSRPEIKALLAGLVRSILRNQPQDLEVFAKDHFSDLVSKKEQLHPPLVIVGPSGVGKGTLISKLMGEFKDHLGFSVSHTTRQARPGEEHGVHYHFSSHEVILSEVEKGEFLEHAEVHGNIYGTSFKAVKNVQQKGKICILDIDVQGMQAVKQSALNPKTLFISPPSHEELERRLRSRGTEKEDAIVKRLENAKGEMELLNQPGEVDYKIVNDELDEAYANLKFLLLQWYPHLQSQ